MAARSPRQSRAWLWAAHTDHPWVIRAKGSKPQRRWWVCPVAQRGGCFGVPLAVVHPGRAKQTGKANPAWGAKVSPAHGGSVSLGIMGQNRCSSWGVPEAWKALSSATAIPRCRLDLKVCTGLASTGKRKTLRQLHGWWRNHSCSFWARRQKGARQMRGSPVIALGRRELYSLFINEQDCLVHVFLTTS